MYSIPDIADAAAAALADEARRLDGEQAVRGIDGLDELALQPIVARGLAAAGFGTFREERYPSYRSRRNHSEGDRCDLVLTEGGRPLAAPDREPTLFDPPHPVALDEAMWLEIKTVAQHTTEGPNRTYASDLLAAFREDIDKLSRDCMILQAGLLVVLFCEDQRVADHDLDAAHARSLDKGLPIGAGSRRCLPIADRLGNALCAIAVHPVGRA